MSVFILASSVLKYQYDFTEIAECFKIDATKRSSSKKQGKDLRISCCKENPDYYMWCRIGLRLSIIALIDMSMFMVNYVKML